MCTRAGSESAGDGAAPPGLPNPPGCSPVNDLLAYATRIYRQSVSSRSPRINSGIKWGADIGRLPDSRMLKEPLLALRGRLAHGPGVMAMAKVRHRNSSPTLPTCAAAAAALVGREPVLVRAPAPEAAEQPWEPLPQQRAQRRQAAGHDAQARLDRVEAGAPRVHVAALLGLVVRVDEHAEPDYSHDCDPAGGRDGRSQ